VLVLLAMATMVMVPRALAARTTPKAVTASARLVALMVTTTVWTKADMAAEQTVAKEMVVA